MIMISIRCPHCHVQSAMNAQWSMVQGVTQYYVLLCSNCSKPTYGSSPTSNPQDVEVVSVHGPWVGAVAGG
jgi:hypothetical protein